MKTLLTASDADIIAIATAAFGKITWQCVEREECNWGLAIKVKAEQVTYQIMKGMPTGGTSYHYSQMTILATPRGFNITDFCSRQPEVHYYGEHCNAVKAVRMADRLGYYSEIHDRLAKLKEANRKLRSDLPIIRIKNDNAFKGLGDVLAADRKQREKESDMLKEVKGANPQPLAKYSIVQLKKGFYDGPHVKTDLGVVRSRSINKDGFFEYKLYILRGQEIVGKSRFAYLEEDMITNPNAILSLGDVMSYIWDYENSKKPNTQSIQIS